MMKPPRDDHRGNERKAARSPQLTPSVQPRQMEEIRHLAREITAATSKMERWMEAMTKLSHAIEDKKALQEVIGTIAKMKSKANSNSTDFTGKIAAEKKDNNSGKSATPSPNSGGKGGSKSSPSSGEGKGGGAADGHKPFSQDGDSLYDLINAPGMTKIVDNVMKVRQVRQQSRRRNRN